MASEHDDQPASTGGSAHQRRLERWTRDSSELRAASGSGLVHGGTPEEQQIARYRRSTTGTVKLRHPALSQRQADRLAERQRTHGLRLAGLALLVPVLLVLAAIIDPVVAKVVLLALLLPVAGLAAYDGKQLRSIGRQRHVVLRGGVADAWSDWLAAREQVEELDGAAQARAALADNEPRLQALVLALAVKDDEAARDWVFTSTAKAKALASAETELDAATRARIDAALSIAPDGDLDSLDRALHTTRELTGGDNRG